MKWCRQNSRYCVVLIISSVQSYDSSKLQYSSKKWSVWYAIKLDGAGPTKFPKSARRKLAEGDKQASESSVFLSNEYQQFIENTNRPSIANETKRNNAKTACMEALALGVVRWSMYPAVHKYRTTLIQSVCSVKQKSNWLLNVKSNLQLRNCASKKEDRRVSSANLNCTAEVISTIEPTQNASRGRHDRTAIDNTSLLRTPSNLTGSHHHEYTNGNCITSSTMVEGGREIANEISNPAPQTEVSPNALRTETHCNNAGNELQKTNLEHFRE